MALGAPDIAAAAAAGDLTRLKLAVVMAIAENPANVRGIVGDAVGRAPQFRDEIATAAAEAFPVFENRIVAAAGTAPSPAGKPARQNRAPVAATGKKTDATKK
ncbi:MAG: hypothetical protein RIE56_01325, partial [Amphiplicatus sp.]